MTAVVAMLRGVNVGGRQMKMDALRAVCESLRLKDARTYVQSGNVVFRTAAADMGALGRKLEAAIEREFGFFSEVILRTHDEMRAVVHGNPFEGRSDVAPARLLAHFLYNEPASTAQDKLSALPIAGEELHLRPRTLYVYYPQGVGVSKIATRVDKAIGTLTTGRNWNSVLALVEMAGEISGK